MSDLTQLRDHARAMSTAQHRIGEKWVDRCLWRGQQSLNEKALKARAKAGDRFTPEELDELWPLREVCPGCVTDAERALWKQIADEIDAYLTPDDDQLTLEETR